MKHYDIKVIETKILISVTCDRCKKNSLLDSYFDTYAGGVVTAAFGYGSTIDNELDLESDRAFDLCDDCGRDFFEWVKQK